MEHGDRNASAGSSPASPAVDPRWLWVILAVSFLIRAGIVIGAFRYTGDAGVFHSSDTPTYVRPALSLLQLGRFEVSGVPEFGRTPGYPLFLIPGLALGQLELVTLSLQVLLSCVTVYLVYRLGMQLFGSERPALLAAGLYALEPLSIAFVGKLLSETLFTFLTMVFLCLIVGYMKRPAFGTIAAAAVVLAASIFVRPIGLFLPGLIGAGLGVWAVWTGGGDRRRRVAQIALFVALSMGATSAWTARNRAVAGYSGFAMVSDVNLYYYLGASVLAAKEGIPYYDMQRRMGFQDDARYFSLHPEQKSWTWAQRFMWMGRTGREILAREPLLYARIHVQGIVRALLDPGAVDLLKLFRLYPELGGFLGVLVDRGFVGAVLTLAREQPGVFWANLVLGAILACYLGFAALGMVTRQVLRSPAALLVAGVAAYYLVIAGGPAAHARFRHADMPVVCLFAALGMVASWRRATQKRV